MKIFAFAIASLPLTFASENSAFSYKPDSDKSPSAWGSLNLGDGVVNQCGGAAQSGIDVPLGKCTVTGDYTFEAGTCNLDDIDFVLVDHVILAKYNTEISGCTVPRMTIPGKNVPYDVLQFHMHTGSDHAVNGRYYGADLHIVHKEVGGSGLSVLGLFLEPTDPDGINKFSDLLTEWEVIETDVAVNCTNFTSLTSESKGTSEQSGHQRRARDQGRRKLSRSFNPYALIPAGATMYTYQGSLTTPPCSEVVFWNVVDAPVSISPLEFVRLTSLIMDYIDPDTCKLATVAADSGFTGRPVQAINGREINRICPTNFVDSLASQISSETPTTKTPSNAAVTSTLAGVIMGLGAGLLTL